MVATVQRATESSGECVVGFARPSSLLIDVDFVATPSESTDLVREAGVPGLIFAGPFPSRDNDGVGAVTATLPDLDGVVRAHPH